MELPAEIILASGSAIRRQLLASAGVVFSVQPADVDEEAVRLDYATIPGGNPIPTGVARALARAKAEVVSAANPDALVIGADQVLVDVQMIFCKPADLGIAQMHLRALRGRSHVLHSAVAIAYRGAVVWETCESAQMTMRNFSDAFLDGYLAQTGERICQCVGAYEYEGLGLQLFERIDGDYFTILGLPMLPLLTELRARGALIA